MNSKLHLDLKKGLLHTKLGIPQGTKIPMTMLMAHKNSDDPHMRKMVQFALNSKKWSK